MPFDLTKKPGPAMPPESDPEEGGEQDAISAALDSIRAAVDDAERTLMMGKQEQPEDDTEPAEGA